MSPKGAEADGIREVYESMLSSHDVLAVLSQLHEGIQGLSGADGLVGDPTLHDAIKSLQKQLDTVIRNVECAARKSGIVPARSILPRPGVSGKAGAVPEAA